MSVTYKDLWEQMSKHNGLDEAGYYKVRILRTDSEPEVIFFGTADKLGLFSGCESWAAHAYQLENWEVASISSKIERDGCGTVFPVTVIDLVAEVM